jgi:hypothetical protein
MPTLVESLTQLCPETFGARGRLVSTQHTHAILQSQPL